VEPATVKKGFISRTIENVIHEQTVDHSNVVPHQRFGKDGKFHLVSCAGHIIYKPKTEVDVSRFRDKWISRFEKIRALTHDEQRTLFFRLFQEIRSTEKVKYRANLRTRLCNLNPLI
jgi:hypothetical protein